MPTRWSTSYWSNTNGTIHEQSPVTHIELYNSAFGIDTLVGSCKVLKSFVYQHNITDTDEIIPSEIRRALLPFQDTLETLRLDFTADYEDYGLFGSLAEFTALKHLHIDSDQLISPDYAYIAHGFDKIPQITDLLPKTLEALHIYSLKGPTQFEFLEHLETLTRAAPKCFPSLREILIVSNGNLGVSTEEIAKRGCPEAGLKYTVAIMCDCLRSSLLDLLTRAHMIWMTLTAVLCCILTMTTCFRRVDDDDDFLSDEFEDKDDGF